LRFLLLPAILRCFLKIKYKITIIEETRSHTKIEDYQTVFNHKTEIQLTKSQKLMMAFKYLGTLIESQTTSDCYLDTAMKLFDRCLAV